MDELSPEQHRRLGADLYNRTWSLIDKVGRTPAEDDEMLDCAHASAYHWLRAGGTAANRARSHWQCSRVHALVGQAEGAVHHARRCLALVEGAPEEMEEFDLPSAYEALARAHAVAGDEAEMRRWLELGRAAAARIADVEDRALIEGDLATIGP